MTCCQSVFVNFFILQIKMDSNRSTQLNTIKRCRVCGGQAVCYNFDVLTCGPCRLFFSRNINRSEDFKCLADGKCEISSTNKRYCRKCRIEKCFEIGMKPKLSTENQNGFSVNQTNNELTTLRGVLECQELLETPKDGLNENLKISLPKSVSKNYFEFNQTEAKYIDELLQNSSSIFNFEEANLPVLYEASNIYQSFNTGMHYVRRVIKYCKSNSVFRSLNEQKQLKVLKRFVHKFIKLRHTFSYDRQLDGFYTIGREDGSCSVLHRPNSFYSTSEPAVKQLVDSKKNLIIKLNEEMANDKTIRDLLVAQAMFGWDKDFSIEESLRYHHWIYNSLLLRYLQCKYKNMKKAQNKYTMLIKVASDLINENKIQQIFLVVQTLDRNQFDELTAEIMNIV